MVCPCVLLVRSCAFRGCPGSRPGADGVRVPPVYPVRCRNAWPRVPTGVTARTGERRARRRGRGGRRRLTRLGAAVGVARRRIWGVALRGAGLRTHGVLAAGAIVVLWGVAHLV